MAENVAGEYGAKRQEMVANVGGKRRGMEAKDGA
jgi:hypothetical protein